MHELIQKSASEVVRQLKSGKIKIMDTLDAVEARIHEVDTTINALPTTCFDRARAHAEELQKLPVEERGALAGLPVTIKDLNEVSGVRTTFGSAIYADYIPTKSDRLVKQIESSGGIVYAKSNTPEFGAGGITFNDVFGETKSPRNIHYASGGSSGGAAASLASGSAWLSVGSDMAGSLRTPAGFCGVTSLRPSPGKIRSDSAYTPYEILSADGPMARNIEDLALFTNAMVEQPGCNYLNAVASPQKKLNIAISQDLGITSVSDEIATHFEKFINLLGSSDHRVKQCHPEFKNLHQCFDVLRAHGNAVSMEQDLHNYPGVMKPEVEWNIEAGLALLPEQIRQATRQQGDIINTAEKFMEDFDLLICPATSVSGVPLSVRYPGSDQGLPVTEYYRWLAIAYATTVSSLPIITIPVDTVSNGMPFAVQLIGKPQGEYALFQCARAIELLTHWSATPIDPITGPLS